MNEQLHYLKIAAKKRRKRKLAKLADVVYLTTKATIELLAIVVILSSTFILVGMAAIMLGY